LPKFKELVRLRQPCILKSTINYISLIHFRKILCRRKS